MKNDEIKLLIVEDISNNIDSIRNALSDFGAFKRENIFPNRQMQEIYINEVVESAKNANSLCDFIIGKINEWKIDALIIDLNLIPGDMPDTIMQSQGMLLIECLKGKKSTCNIPIVALSVREDLNKVSMTIIAKGVLILKKPTAVDPDAVSGLFTKDINDFLIKKCK